MISTTIGKSFSPLKSNSDDADFFQFFVEVLFSFANAIAPNYTSFPQNGQITASASISFPQLIQYFLLIVEGPLTLLTDTD